MLRTLTTSNKKKKSKSIFSISEDMRELRNAYRHLRLFISKIIVIDQVKYVEVILDFKLW